jgi:hypothetical protein
MCAFVYDDYTIRQALEKMEVAGYAALPILNKRGEYRGTLTEGDLLWALKNMCYMDMRQAEARKIMEIDRKKDNIPVRVTTSMYDLVQRANTQNFVPVVEGMWRSVNVSGTSRRAYLEGLDVCGKTGTAENPNGKDHSTFLSFAPKDNPRIAISVYVEHGGFGSAIAVPIASLIEELYLTDTIMRPQLVEEVLNFTPNYYQYDKKQQRYDADRAKSKK